MSFIGEADGAIRTAGGRMTPQRELIIQLLDGASKHLDAEDLYRLAHDQDEKISLATVYRTLNLLKKAGLVDQRYFSRDHGREYYEPVGASEHYHFTCTVCSKVFEFETARVHRISSELGHKFGMQIKHACVCFEGICESCQAISSVEAMNS